MMRWVLFALLLLNGISAAVAGAMLIYTPDGSSMELPLSWLDHSPFHSYRIPGLLLFSVIGIGSLVAAVMVAIRPANTGRFAQVAGGALIIWIVVQMIMLRTILPIQITFLLGGDRHRGARGALTATLTLACGCPAQYVMLSVQQHLPFTAYRTRA